MTAGRAAALVLVASAILVAPAAAQTAPAPRRNQVTVSAGLIAGGSYPIGDQLAQIRSNATGTPPPFTLFRAESTFDPTIGFEGRVAFALTNQIEAEVGGRYAKPQLTVDITGDTEAQQTATVTDTVSRYAVDVSGVWHLPFAFGSRARPYVIGGAGYLRELHADRLIVDSGTLVQAGGGVRYWLRGVSGRGAAFGVRADARLVRRSGGIEFEERSRSYPTVSVLAFAGF
jgi:hypothetical protein